MMDAERLRRVVTTISDTCSTITELRQRRIGTRTTKQFWDALVAANRAIRVTDDPAQRGRVLAQKALWFNHDLLLQELGNLETLITSIKNIIDEDVLKEIADEGYNANRILALLRRGEEMIAQARKDVIAHEDLLQRGLGGEQISADRLANLEYRITGMTHGLEDAITPEETKALTRVVEHSEYRSPLPSRRFFLRAAAGLALAAASSINAAYGQEQQQELKGKEVPVAFEKSTELTEESIETLLGYETVEKVLDENTIIKGANIIYVKYDQVTKKSNFSDILSKIKENGAIGLLYENDPALDYSMRDAIIAKVTSTQFKLPIIAYNGALPSRDADFAALAAKTTGTMAIPSLILGAKSDVVTDKKYETIQLIDTIRGAPAKTNDIKTWITNICNYWIPTNITTFNGEFAWRSQNTKGGKWSKITYKR